MLELISWGFRGHDPIDKDQVLVPKIILPYSSYYCKSIYDVYITLYYLAFVDVTLLITNDAKCE